VSSPPPTPARPARRLTPVVVGLLAAAPLVVAGIVLAFKPWVPVLDMAMTELRVRDVGTRHTPLVGLPGRIGETIQQQGSHPGPCSFYLVAPFYRLSGSRAFGMELASVVLNSLCALGAVALGWRRFGLRGAALGAALAALAVRGYGLNILTHPWNPYFPVLIWLVALLAAWLVLDGDHRLAPLVVLLTSLCAQTHVPYLVNAIALDVLVLAVVVWRWRRGDTSFRPAGAMLGIVAVLWLPPFVEQLRHADHPSAGNIGKLIRHFTSESPEPAIGFGPAGRLVLAHLDWFSLAVDLVRKRDAFAHRAGVAGDPATAFSIGGLVVLLLWIGATWWAWQRRHATLLALHAVIATTLAVGLVSSARIFGKVWYYLTLWMSGTALLVLVALVWSAALLLGEHAERVPAGLGRVRREHLGAAVAGLATVASLIAVPGLDVPEENLAEEVRIAIPDVTAALDRGVATASGHDGTYVVFWQEAIVPGSQGYAVLNELERRGYRVGVHPTFHVPATEHRVLEPGESSAEVHVVSGGWIDEWAATHPGAIEIAAVDDRAPDERERFDALEALVLARLHELGRDELIDVVDKNLFGASLIADLPPDVIDALSEMILLGEPLTIFVAPPGSTS